METRQRIVTGYVNPKRFGNGLKLIYNTCPHCKVKTVLFCFTRYNDKAIVCSDFFGCIERSEA